MKGLGILFVLFALAATPAIHPLQLSQKAAYATTAGSELSDPASPVLIREATGAASPSGLDTDLQSIRKQLTRTTGTFRTIRGLSLQNTLKSPQLSLNFSSSLAQTMHVEIFDFSGKRILSWNEALQRGNNKISFDKKYIASGVYFITATTHDGKLVRKFCAV